MNLNDPRILSLHDISAAIGRREEQLRAAGLPLHAHALSYMLSSLSARDALGDMRVLQSLALECEAAATQAQATGKQHGPLERHTAESAARWSDPRNGVPD